jgi:hypothetical protein
MGVVGNISARSGPGLSSKNRSSLVGALVDRKHPFAFAIVGGTTSECVPAFMATSS